ncbi:hypothetical protein NKH18_15675 [Streptomyces sp. M10(2022)]
MGEKLWKRIRKTEGITVYNIYGQTETTVDSSSGRRTRATDL